MHAKDMSEKDFCRRDLVGVPRGFSPALASGGGGNLCRTIGLRTKSYRTTQMSAGSVSHDTFVYKNLSHDTGAAAGFVSREVGIMNVR